MSGWMESTVRTRSGDIMATPCLVRENELKEEAGKGRTEGRREGRRGRRGGNGDRQTPKENERRKGWSTCYTRNEGMNG